MKEGPSKETYPLLLDVAGRRVLVVGAGPVAARRARGLADAGADVHVVAPDAPGAPDAPDGVRALAAQGRVTWHRRPYAVGDTAGAWLVHTATGVPAVDAAVAAAAEAQGTWCVRADDAAASAAWVPAVARGDDGVVVAVGGGRDPGRARAVRDAVAAGLADGSLPLRRTRPRGPRGRVHLVGAGPGDPDLLTVRARRLLAEADVVVVDRLAPGAALAGVRPDAEVVDVGKAPGRHAMAQEDIDALLVDRARAGLRVVRLKGGDPFVLGRGGEEALACRAAGVPVDVVPGVSSAVAVPAAAGIPVTHRGVAASFVVSSGHAGPGSRSGGERPGGERRDAVAAVLADAAAAPADATLVLLMGVARLREVADGLVRAGRPAGTPVAVVERGWTAGQRTTTATLATVADAAAARGVRSPAVVVVGEVVRLRDRLGDLARVSAEAGHHGGLAEEPAPRAAAGAAGAVGAVGA